MQDQGQQSQRRIGETSPESSNATGGRSTDVSTPQQLERRGDVNKCPVLRFTGRLRSIPLPSLPEITSAIIVARDCYFPRNTCSASIKTASTMGSLLCDVCDQLAEKEESPSIYAEPEDGYWPAWLILVLIVSGLVWYWVSFPVALVAAITLFGLGGFILQRIGLNIFGAKRMVEQQRRLTYFTCVCCGQAVKEVAEIG